MCFLDYIWRVTFVIVFLGSREDIARAILENAIQNTASMTVWTALAKNCRTVYYCGGVFNHQLPRDLFCYFFEGLAMYYGQVSVCVFELREIYCVEFNPFNASCYKLLLFKAFSAILV